MKYLFGILCALFIVIGASAFGDYEKSPPIRAVTAYQVEHQAIVAEAIIELDVIRPESNISHNIEFNKDVELIYPEFLKKYDEATVYRWCSYSLIPDSNYIQTNTPFNALYRSGNLVVRC